MIDTRARVMTRTVTYCAAHYPVTLDGRRVLCTRESGHEGNHQETGLFGDVLEFPDQPECWDTVVGIPYSVLTYEVHADVAKVSAFSVADGRRIASGTGWTLPEALRRLADNIEEAGR